MAVPLIKPFPLALNGSEDNYEPEYRKFVHFSVNSGKMRLLRQKIIDILDELNGFSTFLVRYRSGLYFWSNFIENLNFLRIPD